MGDSIKLHDHNKHARRRREQAEKVRDTVDSIDSNDVEFFNLDDFRGCHCKELHFYKKKHCAQESSQRDEKNYNRGLSRCERTTGYSKNYQCKQFESQRIHTESSIALRREQSSTRYATLFRKCQPKLHNYKKDRKNMKTRTVLQRNMLNIAETGIIIRPITSSSTPGITPASPSPSQNLSLTRLKNTKSHSLRYLMPIKDRSVRHRLKKSHDTNKTSKNLLPNHNLKNNSRRRSFFIAYSKILFLHNKRRIKPKLKKHNKVRENEMKSVITPAIRKTNKREPYKFERDRLPKIQGSSLRVNLSSSSTDVTLAAGSMMQNFGQQGEQSLTECISFSKPISTPYAKTITVYSVFDQKPTKANPAVNLASNASFNVKFYKSMGDGRQMFGDGSPYMQVPRNYSPTDVARGGRDEDGCICVCIPPEPDYGHMGPGHGGNFLKRYLRVLLYERKRCVCANKRPTPKTCLCPNAGRGRVMMPTDNYNAKRNFRANDVSCQCKKKERRERRSDDIFCRDRGTTCSVPTCPDNSMSFECPNVPPNQQQNRRDKGACNIGSNFSFQVGLYKRCIDTNPERSTFSPNYSNMRCIEGDAPPIAPPNAPSNAPPNAPPIAPPITPYSMGRGGDNCCCGTISSNVSILSEQLSPRWISPCMSKSPSERSSLLKQLERNDLCCNNEPKSRCKPKHKAVRCKCHKKPKIIGCNDSKKNVGVVCSSRNLSSSATSASCSCYKVKNIGCCCSNQPIMAECKKKKEREKKTERENKRKKEREDKRNKKREKKRNKEKGSDSLPGSKKSKKKGGICRSTCTGSTSRKKGKRTDLCTCREKKITKKKVNCCRCGEKSRSVLDFFCRRNPPCCCSNEQKCSLVRTLSSFLERTQKEKPKIVCKCSTRKKESLLRKPMSFFHKHKTKSGEFDYKLLLKNLKISSKRQKQAEQKPCPCGSYKMKKVLSELLAPDPTKQTKAQQCKCKKFDLKKMMERILLSNTVNREMKSYSKESYDQYCRSIGTGEEDYRKLPPFRVPDKCQGDGLALKKIVSIFLCPEVGTKMHYSAFNPLNQCEAAMQHNSRLGPENTAGATVCRNQGSCVGKSKPLTVKDCDNATCAALQNVDPNRRAVRIGSSCSFCLEIYKGMPPSKARAPPCPPTCPTPCPAPCAETTTPISKPKSRPCRQKQTLLRRAANYMICNQDQHSVKKKQKCKKCDSCVKVPLIKRGFAHMILRDRRPLLPAQTCQKTNTLQPNRRLVTRKPTAGKGGLGATPNCDPYVCLKRLNQRKCCR